MHDEEGP